MSFNDEMKSYIEIICPIHNEYMTPVEMNIGICGYFYNDTIIKLQCPKGCKMTLECNQMDIKVNK